MMLRNFEFRDNQCSDKATLLQGVYDELYRYCPHLLSNFGEIQHYMCIQCIWVFMSFLKTTARKAVLFL